MVEWRERIPEEKVVCEPLPDEVKIDALRNHFLDSLEAARSGKQRPPANWREARKRLFDALRARANHHLVIATNLSDAFDGGKDLGLIEASFKRGLETELGKISRDTLREADLLMQEQNPDYWRDKMLFHRERGLSLQREAAALKKNVYDWVESKGLATLEENERREIREFTRKLKPEDFED
jgi:hypothetical protein